MSMDLHSLDRMLVGSSVETASAAVAGLGMRMRVVRRNGEQLSVTMDHDPDRVNVEEVEGRVAKVVGNG